jgi:Pyridine nucleotide-disulphide oxidoreductase
VGAVHPERDAAVKRVLCLFCFLLFVFLLPLSFDFPPHPPSFFFFLCFAQTLPLNSPSHTHTRGLSCPSRSGSQVSILPQLPDTSQPSTNADGSSRPSPSPSAEGDAGEGEDHPDFEVIGSDDKDGFRRLLDIDVQPLDAPNIALLDQVSPPKWINPEPVKKYNLVVIGAGAGGLVSAAGSAGLGARVALVEKHMLGGDCLNFGCVPSKALIRCANAAADVRRARQFGVFTTSGDPPTEEAKQTAAAGTLDDSSDDDSDTGAGTGAGKEKSQTEKGETGENDVFVDFGATPKRASRSVKTPSRGYDV